MKNISNEISIFYLKIIYIPNIIKFDKLFNYYIFNLLQYKKYNYIFFFKIYLNIVKYR
jgi:hypothetical protein